MDRWMNGGTQMEILYVPFHFWQGGGGGGGNLINTLNNSVYYS